MINILYICYNRLEATKITLPLLLKHTKSDFDIYAYNNGSTDDTLKYLSDMQEAVKTDAIDTKCQEIHVFDWPKNNGIAAPTNDFWVRSRAEIIGKIDNDIKVFEGWDTDIIDILNAHDKVGAIGHIHFKPETPGYKDIVKGDKFLESNGKSYYPMSHIGGNYLIKKSIVDKTAHMKPKQSGHSWKVQGWTEKQWEFSKKGFRSGYAKPLKHWYHMTETGDDAYYQETRGKTHKQYRDWLG